MDKTQFIIQYESHESLEDDIRLLRQHKPKSKLLSKKEIGYVSMNDKPQYILNKIKETDGLVLGELCDVVTFAQILENRKGNELIVAFNSGNSVNSDVSSVNSGNNSGKKKELPNRNTRKSIGTKQKTK